MHTAGFCLADKASWGPPHGAALLELDLLVDGIHWAKAGELQRVWKPSSEVADEIDLPNAMRDRTVSKEESHAHYGTAEILAHVQAQEITEGTSPKQEDHRYADVARCLGTSHKPEGHDSAKRCGSERAEATDV